MSGGKIAERDRHMAALRRIHPDVPETVWFHVEWRLEAMWFNGEMAGIDRMAKAAQRAIKGEEQPR